MNEGNVFLLSWDSLGLEACIDISKIERDNTWAVLKDQAPTKLGNIVQTIMMRARYNSQRHYEIYTIHVTDGITEQDIRTMFEESPQQAADLIRERGNKIYSDRFDTSRAKIV
jgi:hypothetical protein